jgi:hypothetical protein
MIQLMQFGSSDDELMAAIKTADHWQHDGRDSLLLVKGSGYLVATLHEYNRNPELQELEIAESFRVMA